jgi:uncharacterized protein
MLSSEDKKFLLQIAREAIQQAVDGHPVHSIDHHGLSPDLLENGASFVTLTIHGDLRGCIGALEAYQPLVDDVQEHAVAAAMDDYRFPQLQSHELPKVHIEISHLTPSVRLEYADPEDLLSKLKPGVDGVILRDGRNRATFLPQVWEKVPEKQAFLGQLCQKMGAASDTWRRKHLDVYTYNVEEFQEK